MQAIGIQIDGSTLRWALVKWDGKRLRSLCGQTESIANQVKPLYTEKKSLPIVSGLSCSNCVIRSISFNSAPSKKVLDALILQAQTQLHLKPEETITLATHPGKERQTTTYSTTAAALDSHLETLKRFHLDPERVTAMPAAYLAYMNWKAPYLKSYFLIDVGQNSSSCLWVENGIVQKAHDLKLGLLSLKSAFQEDRKKLISLKTRDEIDFSALKSGQYPTLAEEARSFRRELLKLLYSFHCQRPVAFIGELDLSGPFKDFLWESLCECATEEIRLDLSAEERAYAGSVGLAIDYLLHRKQPLQFRKGGRSAPSLWRKLGSYSLALLTASFFLCIAFHSIGSWWIDKREKEIVRSLETWASTKDPELRFELLSAGGKPENLVKQWLRIIEKNKKEYPFLRKTPRTAFLLNWLSSHPLIDSFRQSGDPISFEQIHYRLESFPRLEALHDPYLAKIELEFKLSNPLHARQLHEALLQDDVVVDTSREITWDVLRDRYRTSFYLKNGSHGTL